MAARRRRVEVELDGEQAEDVAEEVAPEPEPTPEPTPQKEEAPSVDVPVGHGQGGRFRIDENGNRVPA